MGITQTESLDEILDIAPEPTETTALVTQGEVLPELVEAEAVAPSAAPVTVKELEDDFQFARKNVRAMVTDMQSVLTSAMLLAQSGDAPRAYEVVGKLLENIVSANKELVELHRTKKETLDTNTGGQSILPQGGTTINAQQAVFVGRASDLLRELNKQSKLIKAENDVEAK